MFIVFCFLVFGFQYQWKRLPGRIHLQNDPFCVDLDVKPYSLTSVTHFKLWKSINRSFGLAFWLNLLLDLILCRNHPVRKLHWGCWWPCHVISVYEVEVMLQYWMIPVSVALLCRIVIRSQVPRCHLLFNFNNNRIKWHCSLFCSWVDLNVSCYQLLNGAAVVKMRLMRWPVWIITQRLQI